MPTSRATRVTSEAKALSWSTIVLMVSFSSRISPRTSTVILRDRSPRATAVVTCAMLRTWWSGCRQQLTLSVRSFQVPATPGTIAWPPSLPSVPTSRATRVTSEANERSWSTIVLMASLSCRISPRTSTVIFFDRSPLATAMVTSAMLRTWAVRFDAIELTLSVRSFQTPVTSGTCAWPPSLPSVPTSRATRVTSEVNTPSCLIIVLTMVAERRNSPLQRAAVDIELHGLQQVALRHRGDGAGHFGGRPEQVVDQRVDRTFHLAPGAARNAEPHALPGLAFLADQLADPLELLRHALVGGDDLVEGVGDLAGDAELVARHADREIADPHRLERCEQLMMAAGSIDAVGRVFRDGHAIAGLSGGLGGRLHHGLLGLPACASFKRTSRANLQRILGARWAKKRSNGGCRSVLYRTHSARPKSCADPSKTPRGLVFAGAIRASPDPHIIF